MNTDHTEKNFGPSGHMWKSPGIENNANALVKNLRASPLVNIKQSQATIQRLYGLLERCNTMIEDMAQAYEYSGYFNTNDATRFIISSVKPLALAMGI